MFRLILNRIKDNAFINDMIHCQHLCSQPSKREWLTKVMRVRSPVSDKPTHGNLALASLAYSKVSHPE